MKIVASLEQNLFGRVAVSMERCGRMPTAPKAYVSSLPRAMTTLPVRTSSMIL